MIQLYKSFVKLCHININKYKYSFIIFNLDLSKNECGIQFEDIKSVSVLFPSTFITLVPCFPRSLLYTDYPVVQYKSASSLEGTDWFFSKAVTCKMSSVTILMPIVL